MIARLWRGWARCEDAEAYQSHLVPELLPGLSKAKGFLGSHLLRRQVGEEVEFVTIIFWESLDAIRSVAGPNYQQAVIPEERRKFLKRFDTEAWHYQVVSSREPAP